MHPGGVVITPGPIDAYVPVERSAKGVPVIQWDKDGTEDAGLVKIDLLGNRSLGVIRDALTNIRKNHVVFHESAWVPENDIKTQETVARGRTMGCFYIESPAMRLLQQKAGKGDFHHLVIHSSIIRPASNAFIREYIRRLHGGPWDPIHPLLAGVLVAIVFGGNLYGIHNYFTGQQFLNPAYNVPWQQIVDPVRAHWQPDDLVIECYDASFRRYWADDTTMIEYRLPRPLVDMKPVQQFPQSGQRIWLVARDRGAHLPRQMTTQIRDELGQKASEVQIFNFKPLSPTVRRWRSRLLRQQVWDAYIKLYVFVP